MFRRPTIFTWKFLVVEDSEEATESTGGSEAAEGSGANDGNSSTLFSPRDWFSPSDGFSANVGLDASFPVRAGSPFAVFLFSVFLCSVFLCSEFLCAALLSSVGMDPTPDLAVASASVSTFSAALELEKPEAAGFGPDEVFSAEQEMQKASRARVVKPKVVRGSGYCTPGIALRVMGT